MSDEKVSPENNGNNFGAFKGVFIPSILTVLGVILFLRLGWVVGQAGLISALVIIIISSTITFITALSISSTATNATVGPGGSYFLISRCFGVEPGAAVGIPLYLAQAFGISFYSIGFAESLQLLLPGISITVVAMITLIGLTLVTYFSSDLALRLQTFIFVSIILALISFWVGKPVTVANTEVVASLQNVGFWEVFAVFFPAVTGIEAGISMSGDLRDPRKSLPVGTVLVVLIGCLVYLFSAYMFSTFAPPEVLISNNLLMIEIAILPFLIYIGLWGATLSSTMGALLGAPRTLQALAKDRIFPAILAKGVEKTNEPRNALIFSFFIAATAILFGDLNSIASLLSMFFLTSYGCLNLVAGLEGLIDNPSWRPTFRISWLLSLVGAGLCFGAMFMIDPGYSFLAIAAILTIYFIMRKRSMNAQYSDIRSGLSSFFARKFIYNLSNSKQDARNWRPNFLVFAGSPKSRLHLIQIADTISHRRGFITVASILTSESLESTKIIDFEKSTKSFLTKNKIQALTKVTQSEDFVTGSINLIQNYGIGEIVPNTILLGDSEDPEKIAEQIQIIQYAHKRGKNVIIVKDSPSTKEDVKFGGNSIEVWKPDDGATGNLMMALAYMLKSSRCWKRARLVIKVLVKDPDQCQIMQENLNNFVKRSRLRARAEVLVQESEYDYSEMYEASKGADVAFFGIKKPQKDEDYAKIYRDAINQPIMVKTAVFVLAGQDVEFDEIFE